MDACRSESALSLASRSCRGLSWDRLEEPSVVSDVLRLKGRPVRGVWSYQGFPGLGLFCTEVRLGFVSCFQLLFWFVVVVFLFCMFLFFVAERLRLKIIIIIIISSYLCFIINGDVILIKLIIIILILIII